MLEAEDRESIHSLQEQFRKLIFQEELSCEQHLIYKWLEDGIATEKFSMRTLVTGNVLIG